MPEAHPPHRYTYIPFSSRESPEFSEKWGYPQQPIHLEIDPSQYSRLEFQDFRRGSCLVEILKPTPSEMGQTEEILVDADAKAPYSCSDH